MESDVLRECVGILLEGGGEGEGDVSRDIREARGNDMGTKWFPGERGRGIELVTIFVAIST